MFDPAKLIGLGWGNAFQQQLAAEECASVDPARVFVQHRSALEVETAAGSRSVPVVRTMPPVTVGDWILLDAAGGFLRLLERRSLFSRKAAGAKVAEQLIAANVDTAFIVCSLNEDFSLNRIERYLAMVNEAGAEAVIVLSKADLCADPEGARETVRAVGRDLCIETVNCLDAESAGVLSGWCETGQTVAMLGSSGSGKSTLINTLLGSEVQATAAIRAGDDKGRHTTTRRTLLALPGGGLLLDTPGMRELQLAACADGVAATFEDVSELAVGCRFGDCMHEQEPGCAVREALDAGALEPRRFENYQKLMREQAHNSASIAERRARDRDLGKFYKRTLQGSRRMKGDE